MTSDTVVLALDTSSSLGSLTLRRRDRVLASRAFEADRGHSQRLLPALQAAFQESGVTPADVGLFAAVIGPGSFTGLRVSLASLRGLAGSKPCFGALTSDVAAWAARGRGCDILALTDLFHGEVFGAVHGSSGERMTPHEAGGLDDVLTRLGSALSRCGIAVGSAAARHRDELAGRFPGLAFHELKEGLAPHLAEMALANASESNCVPAGDLLPFYLRDPVTRGLLDPRGKA